MKKIFTAEFFSTILIQIILSGIIVFGLQKYYERKWGPLTAAEILSRENSINAKKEAFTQSIDMINRAFGKTKMYNGGKAVMAEHRNIGGFYPNEIEVNACLAKLFIYSTDPSVPKLFTELFTSNADGNTIAANRVKYLNAIGKELNASFNKIDAVAFTYIMIQTVDTLK